MPTYEYKCLKCKKKFEKFQTMSEKPLTRCIHCKGKVERLIGAGAGFIFKGSGFYSTDYRKSDSSAKPKQKDSVPAPQSCPAESKGKDKKSPCANCPASS